MKLLAATYLICAGLLAATGAVAQDQEIRSTNEVTSLLNMLRSSSIREVQAAKDEIVRVRKQIVAQAIAILAEPVGGLEKWSMYDTNPRNLAMEVLGEMRSVEAVPYLIQWLRPREGQKEDGAVLRVVLYSPAAAALIKIGKPASTALVDLLVAKGNFYPIQPPISIMLAKIEGEEGAKFVLRQAHARQADTESKKRIEAALVFMDEHVQWHR